MYAQCPECLTFFRVRPEHLKAAKGDVRCSQCKHVFNALESLRDELTDEELAAVREARRAKTQASAPLLADERIGDLFDQLEYTENGELPFDELEPAPPIEVEPKISAKPHIALREESSPFAAPPKPKTKYRAMYAFLNVLLVLLLSAQLVHAERRAFLLHPQIGPVISQAYQSLGMPLAPPRDLAAIELTRSEVTSHPNHSNALHITGVLKNDAKFPQPWPELHISLQDKWGETVAARYFTAEEYLRDPARAKNLMPQQENIAMELSILDPGPDAVGFQSEICFANGNRHVCPADLAR